MIRRRDGVESLTILEGGSSRCPLRVALVYCYPEFKLRCHKHLKLFSTKVKKLFEPIVLRKKGDGFLLFLKAFS